LMAPDDAHALCNRGLSKIKLGDPEGGLLDLQRSITLDAGNAYTYRNLGMYHIEKGDRQQALDNLEKARSLDSTIPLLEELMNAPLLSPRSA
jgi:Flp pilus assembly protein TadD